MSVVDGANGFVGANLVHQLLAERRPTIALSRRSVAETRQRVSEAVVADTVGGSVRADHLPVLAYSLDRPDLGLDHAARQTVFAEPCDYWHTAALTTFLPGRRHELVRTNVSGTRNALQAFARHAAPGSRFLFVSTAYTCGLVAGPVAESWHPEAPPSRFRNYYELSKRDAELVVRTFLEEHDVTGAVLRLGQVVGASSTGRTTTRNGVYDFIRLISTIASRRPHEDIRVSGHRDALLHLVPIDVSVRWMLRIADTDLGGFHPPVFHVVDRDGVPVQLLGDVIGRHVPVRLHLAAEAELDQNPRSHLERVVAARMAYTGSYLSQPIRFLRDQLDQVVRGEAGVLPDHLLDRLVGSYVAALD